MCVCACDVHVLFACCLHAFVFSAVNIYVHVHVYVIAIASVRKDHLLLLIMIEAYFPCGAIKYIHLVSSVH